MAVYKTNEKMHAADTLYKQWNLSIMFSILNNRERFQEIKAELGSITSKMLSGRLVELQAQELVDKSVMTVLPLVIKYRLTDLSYKPINNLAKDIISLL